MELRRERWYKASGAAMRAFSQWSDATAGLHIWQTGGQDWWKSPKRRTSVTFV